MKLINPIPRFEYIAYHTTDAGYKIDDFSLFANIIVRTEDTVTYERYMKFGKLKCCTNPVTISVEDFNKYYEPITDEIYQKCIKAQEEHI